MRNPNELPTTHEWMLPTRCRCTCKCATLARWDNDRRRGCGCCVGSCGGCEHGTQLPARWQDDDA